MNIAVDSAGNVKGSIVDVMKACTDCRGIAPHILDFFFFFTLDAGLLARSQYSEGPATGHLDTGFS